MKALKIFRTLCFGFLLTFGLVLGGYLISENTLPPLQAKSSFTPPIISLREVPNSPLKELADRQLVFLDSLGRKWEAPEGTLTDGASVPRLGLLITDGRFERHLLKASVIHDAYCAVDNADRCPEQYQSRPWQEVHRMFYEALLAGGTPRVRAGVMFAAVWLGGPRWDDPDRNLATVSDEAIAAEFEVCRRWIIDDEPGRQEIEDWMTRREPQLIHPTAAR